MSLSHAGVEYDRVKTCCCICGHNQCGVEVRLENGAVKEILRRRGRSCYPRRVLSQGARLGATSYPSGPPSDSAGSRRRKRRGQVARSVMGRGSDDRRRQAERLQERVRRGIRSDGSRHQPRIVDQGFQSLRQPFRHAQLDGVGRRTVLHAALDCAEFDLRRPRPGVAGLCQQRVHSGVGRESSGDMAAQSQKN